MKKNKLIQQFREWRDEGENEMIVAAILSLPESNIDDDILNWLAEAYIDIGEYKQAIAVLESQRKRLENDYKWQFRLAVALFYAADDEECDDDESLKRNILERARVCLARGMNMNPPDDALETADRYVERIEDMLDELNDDEDFEDEIGDDAELYDDDELDVIEDHIKEYFGEFPTVFHEIHSPDIHCDIACIPPTKERNYFTLVTMGMGAHIMDIPDELDPDEHGRAELLICLPPDWKLGESTDEWFWPITLLKDLARLPINCSTWLGYGHSVDNQKPFVDGSEFCGSLILRADDLRSDLDPGACECLLPSGEGVNFFQVVPLYREEMNYKIDFDTKGLLEKMNGLSHILNMRRPNYCEGYQSNRKPPIDNAFEHIQKIIDKNLPIDRINGCNHIAIFMRWCIEHGLAAPEFYENCRSVIDGVLDGSATDIREFIMNFFDGCLEMYQLSFVGAGFAHYYYNHGAEAGRRSYPADVDDYAEKYFGKERYESEEFQDEAYMFVPFDEKYYRGMCGYIDKAFGDFYPGFAEYQFITDKEIAPKAERILGCECRPEKYFEDIPSKFRKAAANVRDGHTILLISVSEGSVADNADDLRDLCEDSLQPCLETLLICDIPCGNVDEWTRAAFAEKPPRELPASDELAELQKKTAKVFGTELCVLTFNGERSTLFVPVGEGRFTEYFGKGIENSPALPE